MGEGLTRDDTEAAKWYLKAAAQGDANAQNILGGCFYRGQGVAKDYVTAYKWLSLASAQGLSDAKEAKLWLSKRMTPQEISQASREAMDFKPQKTLERE